MIKETILDSSNWVTLQTNNLQQRCFWSPTTPPISRVDCASNKAGVAQCSYTTAETENSKHIQKHE